MHLHFFDADDFAGVLLQCVILCTQTEPLTGVKTHTAEYLGDDVVLTELPGGLGGTVVQATRPGEVGQHEMARDALMHGLVDTPQQAVPALAERVQSPAGYLALSDVPQDAVDALNRVHYVTDDVWNEELMRTRIIQTDHPAGHAIAHMGIRDDGQPIVLVQANELFLIVLPAEQP